MAQRAWETHNAAPFSLRRLRSSAPAEGFSAFTQQTELISHVASFGSPDLPRRTPLLPRVSQRVGAQAAAPAAAPRCLQGRMRHRQQCRPPELSLYDTHRHSCGSGPPQWCWWGGGYKLLQLSELCPSPPTYLHPVTFCALIYSNNKPFSQQNIKTSSVLMFVPDWGGFMSGGFVSVNADAEANDGPSLDPIRATCIKSRSLHSHLY